jgi:hypothetical protein
MSYHMVWSFVVIWVGLSPYRWYLGFEWLSGIHGFRYEILVLLMGLSLIGYAIWLWLEYPPKPWKSYDTYWVNKVYSELAGF